MTEALVQWKFLPSEDATWDDTDQLIQKFPSLHLQDKVPAEGATNDRPWRLLKPNSRYLDLEGSGDMHEAT